MRIFLLIVTLLVSSNAFCQQIYGTLQDENGDHLPYMNITLKDVQDTTTIAYVASDENGNFKIESKGVKCFLDIAGIGYKTKRITIDDSTRKDIALGLLTIEKDTNLSSG